MKTIPFIALWLALTSSNYAWADLTDPAYKKGLEAYDQQDCKTATRLLEEYKKRDVAFLQTVPKKKAQIDQALAYCKLTLASGGDSLCYKPGTKIIVLCKKSSPTPGVVHSIADVPKLPNPANPTEPAISSKAFGKV